VAPIHKKREGEDFSIFKEDKNVFSKLKNAREGEARKFFISKKIRKRYFSKYGIGVDFLMEQPKNVLLNPGAVPPSLICKTTFRLIFQVITLRNLSPLADKKMF